MVKASPRLVSYIAPGAPATRRPAEGGEAFLRPEIGFTPSWYRHSLSINFGERFHNDPTYRRDCAVSMRRELRRRFPDLAIGDRGTCDSPLDLLTGTYGACTVAAIYGIPILYAENGWPTSARQYLNDRELAVLEPPDLDRNPHFTRLMEQVEWIETREGQADGYINWQGVLNNAHRLRGESLFTDMVDEPEKIRHLFACVCETMIQGISRLHQRQCKGLRKSLFVTVSNCLVNLISPRIYGDLLLPFDRKLASLYDCLGIHNCAWSATPYLKAYAQIPDVGYIDMGVKSDLAAAKTLFPDARRAVMYTPMDAVQKSLPEIEADFRRIAMEYAPCDIVLADLDEGSPDSRVRDLAHLCHKLSEPM